MPVYAEGSIAGVALEDSEERPCKVLIQDAGVFKQTVTGGTQFAADGTPYAQVLTPVGGRAFGVKVEYIPPDVLNDIIAAVNTAIGGGSSFPVALADDITTVEEMCIPDFERGWLSIDEQRTHPETVKGVVFRFLTTGEEVES